jgi:hypothetical protein
MSDGIRPFDSGSQYADWQARNCERCAKWDPNDADPDKCDLDFALGSAYLTDGLVSLEIDARLGRKPNENRYTWDCPERVKRP